jgi:ABC-type polysaccharide/polyol phosphate transport system ATPase subunit
MHAIEIKGISKLYKLGEVGTGTLSHDMNRWWHAIRGKEDPYIKIGQTNNKNSKRTSDYVWALKDINLTIQEGEVYGIIGSNGAGKSTLLKILSKITKPTTGEIVVNGRIASLLEVGTGFHPEMTGLENIYMNGAIMGMRKQEIKHKLEEIIEFSGVQRYIDTPVKRYSSGMKVRLGFAVAAHLEPEILVVDEVLAVGDAEFQKKCLGKMNDVSTKEGRTVLFVSHNMSVVSALCGKGYILKNGQAVFDGPITAAIDRYFDDVQLRSNYEFAPDDSIEASILEVTIIDEFGRQSSTIPFGEKWKIKVKVKVNQPLKNFVVSFKLLDLFNYPVRSVWMPAQSVEEGLYAIEFTEQELLFATGTYKILLGLSANNRYFQFKDDNIHFTITENAVQKSFNFESKNQRAGFVLNPMATKFYKL